MKRRHLIAWVGLAATALVVSTAALAWACTAQSYLHPVKPSAGPAGTSITLSGFATEPLEIRWNSDQGPVLGKAPQGRFSMTATVPQDAPAGNYFLSASGRALEAFTVTSSHSATAGQSAQVSQQLWSGFSSDSSSALQGPDAQTQPQPAPSPSRSLGLGLLAGGAAAMLLAGVLLGSARLTKGRA